MISDEQRERLRDHGRLKSRDRIAQGLLLVPLGWLSWLERPVPELLFASLLTIAVFYLIEIKLELHSIRFMAAEDFIVKRGLDD